MGADAGAVGGVVRKPGLLGGRDYPLTVGCKPLKRAPMAPFSLLADLIPPMPFMEELPAAWGDAVITFPGPRLAQRSSEDRWAGNSVPGKSARAYRSERL